MRCELWWALRWPPPGHGSPNHLSDRGARRWRHGAAHSSTRRRCPPSSLLDGQPAGLATYAVRGAAWELVTIAADTIGREIGRMLISAVEELATAAEARRIWMVTTNDNTRALRFYQRSRYHIVALDRDAVTRVRATLKPTIPLTIEGIAMRHELHLEKVLTRRS